MNCFRGLIRSMNSEENDNININYQLVYLLLHEYGFVFNRTMSAPYLPCKFPFFKREKSDFPKFCKSTCFLLHKNDLEKLMKRLFPSLNFEKLNCFTYCADNPEYICGICNPQGEKIVIDYTEPYSVKKLNKLREMLESNAQPSSMLSTVPSMAEAQVCIQFWLAGYIYCLHNRTEKFYTHFMNENQLDYDNFLAELLDFYNRKFYVNKKGDSDKIYLSGISLSKISIFASTERVLKYKD